MVPPDTTWEPFSIRGPDECDDFEDAFLDMHGDDDRAKFISDIGSSDGGVGGEPAPDRPHAGNFQTLRCPQDIANALKSGGTLLAWVGASQTEPFSGVVVDEFHTLTGSPSLPPSRAPAGPRCCSP